VNGWIIFILLIALMLTGMPISIALGLTVLTFLFFLTDLPAELVSQRLFTGLDQFAIMAIRFSSSPEPFSPTAEWRGA